MKVWSLRNTKSNYVDFDSTVVPLAPFSLIENLSWKAKKMYFITMKAKEKEPIIKRKK